MSALRLAYRALGFAIFVGSAPFLCAELSRSDMQRLESAKETVAQAGTLYTTGKYAECAQAIEKAQRQFAEAVRMGGAEVIAEAEPHLARVRRAAALLELEGIRIAPVDLQEVLAAATAEKAAMKEKEKEPKTPPAKKPEPTKPAPPAPAPQTGVSFVKDVAPILMNQCGRCHVTQSKGNFSMSSFAVLMKGPPEGVVIFAGDTIGSRLIETIETGDMPRGGGRVPAAQVAILKKWINEGAKFDGPSAEASLASLVGQPGAAPPPPTEPMNATRSTGKETVSFARQVAPLLLDNCNGCHIDAMQTRGGLRMDTLAQLLKGGDSGAVVTPGDGNGSLLIKMLRGQSEPRMPAGGRPPLSDSNIQLISTWIAEGATLDEGTQDQPLRVLAARAWARAATPEQLTSKRLELAKKNWMLGNPGVSMTSTETPHFAIHGEVGKSTLEMVAKSAEATVKEISAITRVVGSEKPFRGSVTIFVFPKRYGYSEFGRMIESRTVPAEWTGHWRYDGIDAYVALVVTPSDTAEAVTNRLEGLLTSLAIAQIGDAPRWLSEGIGRMVSARSGGKNGPGIAWDAAMPEAMTAISKPEEFLDGKLPPEQADVLSYGIAKFLFDRSNRGRTDHLLRALAAGKSVEESIAVSYNVKPQDLIGAFAVWQRNQPARRR
jgi:hypothetical protein